MCNSEIGLTVTPTVMQLLQFAEPGFMPWCCHSYLSADGLKSEQHATKSRVEKMPQIYIICQIKPWWNCNKYAALWLAPLIETKPSNSASKVLQHFHTDVTHEFCGLLVICRTVELSTSS
jgi:hypothetical protein